MPTKGKTKTGRPKSTANRKVSEKSLKNLRPFKKGQSGNPKGKPPLPADLKKIKNISREELRKRLTRFMMMSGRERAKFTKNSDTIGIDRLIISVIDKGISGGDTYRFNFLIEQIMGKLPEKFEHSSPDGSMKPAVQVYVPDNKRDKK